MAQINVAGTPYTFLVNDVAGRSAFGSKNVTLGKVDNSREQSNAYSRQSNCPTCPPQYGKGISVAVDVKRDGVSTQVPGGRIWRVTFNSETSLGMQFHFNEYNLPAKASLFIYNQDHSEVLGAFTHINNHPDRKFATRIIHGKAITLEYFEADENAFSGELAINRVIHVFKDVYSATADEQGMRAQGLGDALSCMININCPDGDLFKDLKKGVCRILAYDHSSNMASAATGFLVNNLQIIRAPYVLTTWHTQIDKEDLNDRFSEWVFEFDYEKPSCEGIFGPIVKYSHTGARPVTGDNEFPGADYLLLDLQVGTIENYMDVAYLGWDIRTNMSYPKTATIHHPAADVKKISLDTDPPVAVHLMLNGDDYISDNNNPKLDYKVTWNNKGVTEKGSSGSPLIEQLDYRVIGYLRAGYSDCNTAGPDYYTRLSTAWTQYNRDWFSSPLKNYLDPANTRETVVNSYVPRPTTTPPSGATPDKYNSSGTLTTSQRISPGVTLYPTYKLGVFDDGKMGECELPADWKITFGVAGTVNIPQNEGGGKAVRMESGGYSKYPVEIARAFPFEKGKEYILTLRVYRYGAGRQLTVSLKNDINYRGSFTSNCGGIFGDIPKYSTDQEIMNLGYWDMNAAGLLKFATYAVKFVPKQDSKYVTVMFVEDGYDYNDPQNRGLSYIYLDEVYLFESPDFINTRANDDWNFVAPPTVSGDTCANRSLTISSQSPGQFVDVVPGTSYTLSSRKVVLKSNFKASEGSNFRMYVGGCASTKTNDPSGPLEKNNISTMGRLASEPLASTYDPVKIYSYDTLENIFRQDASVTGHTRVAEQLFHVSVSPNPTRDRITIYFTGADASVPYSILDITGNEIMRGVASEKTEVVDLSRYGNGIYFVKAHYHDRNYVTRVVLLKN